MTHVRFQVSIFADGDVRVLDEPEIARYAPPTPPDEIDGAIVIDVDDRRLVIADDLTAAAYSMCFQGPATILGDEFGIYLYRRTQATVHTVLIPLATDVRIFGEETPVITDRMSELLPALYQCGLRVIDFLERVGDPPEAAFTAAELRAAAKETASAMHQTFDRQDG